MFLTCSCPPFPLLLPTVAVAQDPGSGFIPSSCLHFREAPHDRGRVCPQSQREHRLPLHQNSLSSAPLLGASAKGLNGSGESTLVGLSLRNRRSSLSSSIVPLHFKCLSKFPGSHCFCQGVPNPSNREQKGNVGEGREHGCRINLH